MAIIIMIAWNYENWGYTAEFDDAFITELLGGSTWARKIVNIASDNNYIWLMGFSKCTNLFENIRLFFTKIITIKCAADVPVRCVEDFHGNSQLFSTFTVY